MKTVYKNPKELATKLMDLIDSYREGMITYEKLVNTLLLLIKSNENSIYKNGFMPTKLANVIGEERKALIDEIVNKTNKINN